MNVHEFVEKFNSLSGRDKDKFLAYIHGAVTVDDLKKYEIIERAFAIIEKKN